ncbi:hypothetical protein BC629DRAFT_1597641 [Irpex lacteus]|nr:hypothetical protein BC629DRAFT_1597641 [Irpex lacteus]
MTSTGLGETIEAGSAATSPSSPYDSWASDCSLMELVLSGCLDGDDASPPAHDLKGKSSDMKLLTQPVPRALLARAQTWYTTHRQFARHSSSSPAMPARSTSSSLTSYTKPTNPTSPLAKAEPVADMFKSLPTPPDSEESGAESGPGDVFKPPSSKKDADIVTVLDGSDRMQPKKQRWKFWRRPGRLVS